MWIVVTGGRDYGDYDTVKRVLECFSPTVEGIAHGGAPGADALAYRFCREFGVSCQEYVANWSEHGRAAGPIRNREMLDAVLPWIVVAFPGGRGTEDCIKAAKERGIPVLRVEARQAAKPDGPEPTA